MYWSLNIDSIMTVGRKVFQRKVKPVAKLLSASHWFRHSMFLKAVVLLVAVSMSLVRPAFADYELAPGDSIRVSLTGLEELSFDAKIDALGGLDLQWLGHFTMVETSLDQLEQLVRKDAAGRIVKQYNQNGEIFIIQLDGDEIEITRTAYRDIIIGGDVARTGRIEFRPMISVREAVALAGGIRSRLLADDVTIDPIQLMRWQTIFGEAALQHAQAKAQVWRTTSELSGNMNLDPPSTDKIFVSPKVFDELIAEQTEIRRVNELSDSSERQYFKTAEEQIVQRQEILRQQRTELSKALEADEIEEARVLDLVERGLAAGSRIADIRRTTVTSATRRLDVEEDLSAANLMLTRLMREKEAFEQERIARLFQERSIASLSVRDASLQMDTISKYLAGASNEIGMDDLISDIDYTATIYRTIDGQTKAFTAEKSTQVHPGDSIEISVKETSLENPLTE